MKKVIIYGILGASIVAGIAISAVLGTLAGGTNALMAKSNYVGYVDAGTDESAWNTGEIKFSSNDENNNWYTGSNTLSQFINAIKDNIDTLDIKSGDPTEYFIGNYLSDTVVKDTVLTKCDEQSEFDLIIAQEIETVENSASAYKIIAVGNDELYEAYIKCKDGSSLTVDEIVKAFTENSAYSVADFNTSINFLYARYEVSEYSRKEYSNTQFEDKGVTIRILSPYSKLCSLKADGGNIYLMTNSGIVAVISKEDYSSELFNKSVEFDCGYTAYLNEGCKELSWINNMLIEEIEKDGEFIS